MKVGVIGVGYWGPRHVEEYLSLGIKDILVVDLKPERLEFCKKTYGVETAQNYKKIFQDPSISAVSICTPNETHYQLCKEALESGKHVLLEKPMATNYEHALDLVKTAKKTDRVLLVGHIFRFNNAIRRVKQMVKQGELGDIQIVRLNWTNREPVWDRDIIFDLAPHPVDIVNFVFPDKKLEQISAIGKPFRKAVGEEAAFINAIMENALVNFELSWLTPEKIRKFTIVGSDKTVIVDCLTQVISIKDYLRNETIIINPEIPNNTLRDELNFFINCINDKVNYSHDPNTDVRVVKILETMKKSLDEKIILNVED
ncbi:MAG: Gfo/Idh/MocA family oxidoreductase [Candidatus Aenigmatarchaeota archaeon]